MGVLPEKYNRFKVETRNTVKMQIAGLLPRGWCGGFTKEPPQIDCDKVPFSNFHNTHKDYMNDIDECFSYIEKQEEIPDEIIIRLQGTIDELGLAW